MLRAKQEKNIAAGTAFDVFNRAAPSSKEDKEKIVNAFLSISESELQGLAFESIKEVSDIDYAHTREILEKNTFLDERLKD